MPNLETLRSRVVFSDPAATTKIIGEYTVLSEAGFTHCIIALRSCPEKAEDTIHYYRFEKGIGEQIWVQKDAEVTERLPGRIVFPSLLKNTSPAAGEPDEPKKYESS
jgi:hypothetical protein